MIQIFALYLGFAKNFYVLQVLIWGFGGHWRFLTGFGILILIWIWMLVFDTIMIPIIAFYLDFEGAKNIYVLKVFIWGFGGR